MFNSRRYPSKFILGIAAQKDLQINVLERFPLGEKNFSGLLPSRERRIEIHGPRKNFALLPGRSLVRGERRRMISWTKSKKIAKPEWSISRADGASWGRLGQMGIHPETSHGPEICSPAGSPFDRGATGSRCPGRGIARRILVEGVNENRPGGTANCGEVHLFNHVVGYRAMTANFPGRPWNTRRPKPASRGRDCTCMDLPGTYSLVSGDRAEMEARRHLLSGEVDLIINVLDASLLGRSLELTCQNPGIGKYAHGASL